ncbi:basic leucine zipper 9-like [Andrographis paniculata]|uniref:basic leucine zipper 9-like n=1 Tax=Andrographis paniculata TaxID=175694 RepID=UPI0021E6E5A1|nr:basic leucine zipper 9-like [Andrographis paniculata]
MTILPPVCCYTESINTPLMSSYSPLSLFLDFPTMFSGSSVGLCPPSEPGFLDWELISNEPLFFLHEADPILFGPSEPVSSNSGSDAAKDRDGVERFGCGSYEPDKSNNSKNLSPAGSAGLGLTEERKRRRMLSNRASAQRSRQRKQQHLKELRCRVNRFKVVNRKVMGELRFVLGQTEFVIRQNECLQAEAVVLRRRLSDMRRLLIARQLQQQYYLNNLSPAAVCMAAMH